MPSCLSKLAQPSNTTGERCEMECPFIVVRETEHATIYICVHVYHQTPVEDLPRILLDLIETQPNCKEVVIMGDFNATTQCMQVPEEAIVATSCCSQLTHCTSDDALPELLKYTQSAFLQVVEYLVTHQKFIDLKFLPGLSKKGKKSEVESVVKHIFPENKPEVLQQMTGDMYSDHSLVEITRQDEVYILSWNVMGGRYTDVLTTVQHFLMKDETFLAKANELFRDNGKITENPGKNLCRLVAPQIATQISECCTAERCERLMDIVYSKVSPHDKWIVALQECPLEIIEAMQVFCAEQNAMCSGPVHRSASNSGGDKNTAAMLIATNLQASEAGTIKVCYSAAQNNSVNGSVIDHIVELQLGDN